MVRLILTLLNKKISQLNVPQMKREEWKLWKRVKGVIRGTSNPHYKDQSYVNISLHIFMSIGLYNYNTLYNLEEKYPINLNAVHEILIYLLLKPNIGACVMMG